MECQNNEYVKRISQASIIWVTASAENTRNRILRLLGQFPEHPTHNNRFMVVKGLSCILLPIVSAVLCS